MNKHMKMCPLLLVFSALVCLIVVLIFFLSGHARPSKYTYGDYPSSIPAQMASGDTLTILWRPYAAIHTTPTRQRRMIMLTVLLVRQADVARGVCGAWHAPIVLDVLQTTNQTG